MSLTSRLFFVLGVPMVSQLTGCRGCVEYNPDDPSDVPFESDWGRWMSMAVTQSGQPAIASYDTTNKALDYAVGTLGADAVTWEHEPVDGHVVGNTDLGDHGQYASLAIASDGTAWVSYYDASAKVLKVAHRSPSATGFGPVDPYGAALDAPNDSAWITAVADSSAGATPDAGQFTSLALDAAGSPVVAHYDAGAAALRVVHLDDAGFHGEAVDSGDDFSTEDTGKGSEVFGADVGQYANIAIHDGTEYIAYYDAAAGDLKLATGTAGNYAIEIVDDGVDGPDARGDVGAWPDILVQDGTLTIAYQDVENQDLKVATGTPGNWAIETVDSGPYAGADCATFVAGNTVNVLYFDGSHNNMKRAKHDGSWQTGTVAEDGALGYHSEVVDIDGQLYGASYNYTEKNVWFAPLAP